MVPGDRENATHTRPRLLVNKKNTPSNQSLQIIYRDEKHSEAFQLILQKGHKIFKLSAKTTVMMPAKVLCIPQL
jgi:hypothetical protein